MENSLKTSFLPFLLEIETLWGFEYKNKREREKAKGKRADLEIVK